jgi:hypothetical protein
MNKFFTPTSIRVSSRLNDYLKENFGYTVEGDIKELQKAKAKLEVMQESGKNYVETTMMLEAIKALLHVRMDEVSADLAKRYKKRAKMDMEFNDDDIDRNVRMHRYGTDDQSANAASEINRLQKRNTKRHNGIKRANQRIGEAAKPDFLDVDKDGNKKEPMKKALDDKKKKVDEAGIKTAYGTTKTNKYGGVSSKSNKPAPQPGTKEYDKWKANYDKKKKVNEVDMGQAKSVQDKKDEAGSKKGKYNVVNGNGKVVSSHDNHGDAMRAANKKDEYKVKKVNESVTLQRVLLSQLNSLLEGDAASAEITMAARGIVDELQDIIEKLGKIQNDQLGPLADQMAYSHGADQSTTFKSSVDEAISGLLDNARSAKDAVNNAVLVLSGEQPATDTMAPSSEDIGGDMADDFEDDIEADIDTDVVGGDEAMSGPKEEPLGRARR